MAYELNVTLWICPLKMLFLKMKYLSPLCICYLWNNRARGGWDGRERSKNLLSSHRNCGQLLHPSQVPPICLAKKKNHVPARQNPVSGPPLPSLRPQIWHNLFAIPGLWAHFLPLVSHGSHPCFEILNVSRPDNCITAQLLCLEKRTFFFKTQPCSSSSEISSLVPWVRMSKLGETLPYYRGLTHLFIFFSPTTSPCAL